MTSGFARKRGFVFDEKIAGQQVKANVAFLEQKRDLLHQGFFFGAAQGDPQIVSYMLIGLDAERYKPDLNTDAVAMFGRPPNAGWPVGVRHHVRPPLCADGDIAATVLSMRGLQLYAPNVDKAAYQEAVRLAGAWLASAQSRTHDDRSWRLLGLAWVGTKSDATRTALREVLAVQRFDGGWADLASTESTADATGKALVALQAAGVPVSDAAYQRGVRFLLATQMQDGSWDVRKRAAGSQPYFENGFPHGVDQWISAAATSWATDGAHAGRPRACRAGIHRSPPLSRCRAEDLWSDSIERRPTA